MFWEAYFSLGCIKEERVVIGGDLNFTLSRVEVWGELARLDRLLEFFRHKIEDAGLVDVEPIKLVPT